MRRATLALPFLLLLAAPVGTAMSLPDLRFEPPGQVGPDLHVDGSQWLLVVFSEHSQATGTAGFPGPVSGEEFQEAGLRLRNFLARDYAETFPLASTTRGYPAFQGALAFGGGPASIYIEAASI